MSSGQRSRRHKALLWGGAAAGVLAIAQPAAAQTDVQELVVTARKVEENLRDVPVAVTALSAEALEERLVQDITDLSQYTPGFQVNEGFGRSADRPVIRGASNVIATEGKVGIFVDGIPFFGSFTALDLENASRVEVIRGPQSAVFGRGTLSGAVNVVTREPTDEFSGRIKATYGRFDRKELGAQVSGPLTSWLGADAGFKVYQIEGMFPNTAVPGTEIGGQKSEQITFGLYADPTPDIAVSARYMYTHDDDQPFAAWLQPAAFNNCFLTTRTYYCGEVRTPGPFALNTDKLRSPGLSRTGHRGFFDASWDVMGSGYTLSYQAGVTELTQVSGIDQSYDARDFFLIGAGCRFARIPNSNCALSPFNTTTGSFRTAVTHEARISSPADQPIRWRVGLYRGLDRSKDDTDYLELSEVGPDVLGDSSRAQTTALFGALDWDITDTLTLGLELRRQQDKIRAVTPAYGVAQYISLGDIQASNFPTPNQVAGTPGVRNAKFEATLPRATLTWKATPDLTVYAQYSQGNAPGGFNPVDAPQTTFDEEKLKNYELGVKTTMLGFTFLGATAFFQQYDGQVLTNTYVTPTLLSSYRANLGETEIKGLELEGSRGLGLPGLSVQFSYSYLDAEITKGVEPEQAILLLGTTCKAPAPSTATNLDLPGCRAAASIVGKRPPQVSKHSLSVGLRYEAEATIAGFAPFASVDYIYRSSFFDQVTNLAETGDFKKVNVQFGIQDGQGLRAYVWGRNIFDNDTPEGILRFLDFLAPRSPSRENARAFAITAARPMEWGVTVSKSW
jgi:iron complex outermembrane recepter protein